MGKLKGGLAAYMAAKKGKGAKGAKVMLPKAGKKDAKKGK